jgi:hypothetical protein
MTVHGLTRTAPLANGFRARFSYAPDHGLLVEWFPDTPRMIRCWTTRRRFMATYNTAKRAFLSEVSASTGASIGALNSCGELEPVPPARTH